MSAPGSPSTKPSRREYSSDSRASPQHHPVHELHRGRPEVERHHPRFERRQQTLEVQDRQPHGRRQPVEFHPRLDHGSERSLGANDQMREVHPAGIEKHIEVVARDPARNPWKTRPDVLAELVPERHDFPRQAGERPPPPGRAGGCRPSASRRAAPGSRRAAPRWRPGHCPPSFHRRASGRRRSCSRSSPPRLARFEVEVSGPKRSPRGRERGAQRVLHHPRLHSRPEFLAVHLEDGAEVLRQVQHQRLPHRLSGQRGPSAARQHGCAGGSGGPDRFRHIRRMAGDHDPDRFDLVDARIIRVEDPGRPVEADIALDARLKVPRQLSHAAARLYARGGCRPPGL